MPMTNYTFTFNGLTIGNGTNYLVTNVEGLGGTAPLRIQDDNRGYLDGSYSGRDFYDERTVYIDVTVLGDSTATAQSRYKDLQAAFAPQPLGYYFDPSGYTPASAELQQFNFRLNGNTGDMTMFGRSRGLVTAIDPDFTYGYIQTRIQMTFPDPRYYSDYVIPAAANSVTMTNNGWAISCPVIYITTNATSGYVTDGTTYMYFANMLAGQTLTIDLLQRIVYLNNVPTRNIMTAASNGWLQLNPKSTTTFTSTVGQMLIPYQSAYV